MVEHATPEAGRKSERAAGVDRTEPQRRPRSAQCGGEPDSARLRPPRVRPATARSLGPRRGLQPSRRAAAPAAPELGQKAGPRLGPRGPESGSEAHGRRRARLRPHRTRAGGGTYRTTALGTAPRPGSEPSGRARTMAWERARRTGTHRGAGPGRAGRAGPGDRSASQGAPGRWAPAPQCPAARTRRPPLREAPNPETDRREEPRRDSRRVALKGQGHVPESRGACVARGGA